MNTDQIIMDSKPWPKLSGSRAPKSFPLDALPPLGSTMARAVANCVQVPVDLPACFLLGALSTAVVGRAQVEPWPGYREPLQLFILASASPSERKSATLEMLFAPIHRYQMQENKRRKPLISRSASRREAAELALKRAIAQGDSGGIDAALRDVDAIEEVQPFELIISDATTEAMAMFMARNDGRAALISAEGGMLMNLCGRYSAQQSANVDVMLHGYSGEPMYQERVGRGTLQIRRTAVSLCLAAQPGVVQSFLSSSAMIECGMVSRFLVASPRTALGSRKLQGTPADTAATRAWEEKLHRLLDRQDQMLLRFNSGAAALFDIWGEEIEQRLCPGRDLHDLAGGFGGKLRGNTARIAGLLRLLADDEPESRQPSDGDDPAFACYHIRAEDMQGAIDIARYFLSHMLQLCGFEDLSAEADAALKLLVKLGADEFSASTVRYRMRGQKAFERAEQVEAVFDELERWGCIRLKAQQPAVNSIGGRPRKPMYELHPALTGLQEPSAKHREDEQEVRRIISQGLEVYTQADEAKREGMRKLAVSIQQQLDAD